MKNVLNLFHRPCNDGGLSNFFVLKGLFNNLYDLPNNIKILDEKSNEGKKYGINLIYKYTWGDKTLIGIGIVPFFDKLIETGEVNMNDILIYLSEKIGDEIFFNIEQVIETDIFIENIPLINIPREIFFLDHHRGNTERFIKSRWNKLEDSYDIKIYEGFNEETCGANITKTFFNIKFEGENVPVEIPIILEGICNSDIYKFDGIDKDFALAISKYFHSNSFLDFIEKIYKIFVLYDRNEIEKLLDFVEFQLTLADYYKNIFVNYNNIKQFSFYGNNGELLVSFPVIELPTFEFNDLSQEILREFNIPLMGFINFSTNENTNHLMMSISLRSNKELAKPVAQFFGGNGHPNASGCQIDITENINNIILQKLPDSNNIRVVINL